ncbi:hypothetical protein CSB11_02055 [Candidatus Campbellbacteria bacterium]|nr:MAG: hypothetical protein CSB11_02055 [Candidatus Campbellbacteria bacterium]
MFKKKKKNIWQKLKYKKPEGFFVLAPMADVTDNPFRKIINQIGKPDLFYTEFGATDGLASEKGYKRIKTQIFNFEKNQKPIIAQIFGGKPENYKEVAKKVANMGFDGIDLNTGCPQKNILKQKSGSELIKEENWDLVRQIIQNIKKGIKESKNQIPFSLKTRIGFNQYNKEWIKFLLEQKLDALIIHLRTKKEMSKVQAHWELAKELTELKNKISPNTVLIFNGDIKSKKEGFQKLKENGADGIMIGRGIFENPTLFRDQDFSKKSVQEKTKIMLKHAKYFEKEFGKTFKNKILFGGRIKPFALMKKFFKIYINGFDGAKEFREHLMKANSLKEVEQVVKNHLKKL